MTVQEALKPVYAPQGLTSILSALMTGEFPPVNPQKQIAGSIEEAEAQLQGARRGMKNPSSDWAYWGYAGQAAYWSCVKDILEAASIVGPDNLPDVQAPSTNGAVMDVQSNMIDYGQKILALAKAARPK